MFRASEDEGQSEEQGQEQEGKPTKVRAKPRDEYSELENEVYSLKDRLNRLEAQKTQRLGERPADKNVGTAFPEELIDRLNKTRGLSESRNQVVQEEASGIGSD